MAKQDKTNSQENSQAVEPLDRNNLPGDFQAQSKGKPYEPLKAGTYQVQVMAAEVIPNSFYKPDEKDPSKKGQPYQIRTKYTVLKAGDNYGHELQDFMPTFISPSGKKGPSKTYKFVTAVLGSDMDQEACDSFVADGRAEFMDNLDTLVGKQLIIVVEVSAREDGSKKNKVASYLATEETLPPFDATKVKTAKK